MVMRRVRMSPFQEAEAELEFYFAAAEGALGMHGSGGEPGGGSRVWDSKRSHAAHLRLRAAEHRHEVERYRIIHPTIAQLSNEAWGAAFVTFAPRRWPEMVAPHFARGAQRGNLVALALGGDLLRAAWLGREEAKRRRAQREARKAADLALLRHLQALGTEPDEPAIADLLQLLVQEAESTKDAGGKARFFVSMRDDAEARLLVGVSEYEAIMRAREGHAMAKYVGDAR